ncbi:galactosyltransferase-related protein [Alistipes sp. ZOR0009]|uniref:galactosyltransferase-related protein n=1 Tax=Alistipes sp. ZOR0009 TaxID=1339253 RepID=UPI000647E637|nr:galactosyltransferase-related protein [Alistipes sp. ZOR0009]
MKADLSDTTFLILIRLDSIHRLENILTIVKQLKHSFSTNIIVREADSYNNGILKYLLKKHISYQFVEDKDPVLYKTKHINQMIQQINTPFIALWDADIVVDKKIIIECIEKLRMKEVDVAYPYNGICYDILGGIRTLFLKKTNINILYRHIDKLNFLYHPPLYGGAVLLNRSKFIKAGMENEKHYGWGCDDFDRYERFKILEYNIFRSNKCLFHLYHSREKNSYFRNENSRNISVSERYKNHNSSKFELLKNDQNK